MNFTYKKSPVFLILALFFFTSDNCFPEINRPMPSELKYPGINFFPPKPEKFELKNGMLLFLLEDNELPVLDVNALIRSGSIYEPLEQTGLASLTSSVMRTGGTKSMTGDEIDEKLEFIAGSVGVHANYTNLEASLSVMKKDVDAGLKIFADILMYPVFEQAKLDLAKKAAIEGIRRKNDAPGSIAAREFRKIVYSGHPLGRESTMETISSITREDLIGFHKKYLYPNRIILSVTGDFKKEEIIKQIEEAFKGWENKETTNPVIKPLEKNLRYSVNYAEKDIPQTVIRLGHLGVKITNPDHYALELMNDILGGNSFQSRLMQDIRTDRGLAYSVYSGFSPGIFDYGTFLIGLETKAGSTAETMDLLLAHIRKIREEPVTGDELENAKKFIANSFVFKFNTSSTIVNRMAFFEYYGIPMDYLETYLDNIRKVTREDIRRVAREYLRPEGLTITVVGNKKYFDRPLSEFGEVSSITLEKFE